MAKHKSKPQKKMKKALRKARKKGPFVAALAIIAGELVAGAKRARLDRRIMEAVEKSMDRFRGTHEPATA